MYICKYQRKNIHTDKCELNVFKQLRYYRAIIVRNVNCTITVLLNSERKVYAIYEKHIVIIVTVWRSF